MEKSKEKAIFPLGEKITNDYFTGTAWLEMLITDTSGLKCTVGNVTFEPGCRNNWHKHPGGQILLVTEGRGWYQEWGSPARKLGPGDAVEIPAGVKHWHGAAKDSPLVHLAIGPNAGKGPAEWLEPVSDGEYGKLE